MGKKKGNDDCAHRRAIEKNEPVTSPCFVLFVRSCLAAETSVAGALCRSLCNVTQLATLVFSLAY